MLIIFGPGNVSVVNLSLAVAILGATGPLRMFLSRFPLLQLTVTLNLPWVVGNMPKKNNEEEYYLWSCHQDFPFCLKVRLSLLPY